MLARQRPQRGQPVVDALQRSGVEVDPAREVLELGDRVGGLGGGAIERGEGRAGPLAQARRDPLQLPACPVQGPDDALALADLVERPAQGLRQLLAAREDRAPLRQRGRLARFRGERVEFVARVTQEFGVDGQSREIGPARGGGVLGRAPVAMGPRGRGVQRLVAGEGVEGAAMGGRVEQALGLELAVDLDQRGAQFAQQPDRDRLVVDEGAAAAVGTDQPPQDQVALGVQPLGGGQGPCRMTGRQVEDRGHAGPRGALAHGERIGAGAEREAERVEQDRLAGAGLAGQGDDARLEGDVERLDQDDVADGEAGQHAGAARLAPGKRRRPSISGGLPDPRLRLRTGSASAGRAA
jgi:hypothetical protein